MANTPNITTERMIALGIRLLETLTATPQQTLDINDAARALGVPAQDIPSIVSTLGALSDRSSGARAALSLEGNTIRLVGDSALIMPLRLSVEEGMVLSHVLDVLNIDDATRERVQRSLMPLDETPSTEGLAEPSRYGQWFTRIGEALEDGVRCTMAYRSLTQESPAERLIDPIALQEEADAVYLIAWDINKDAERRYRLDRIDRFEFTDDSVSPHDAVHRTTAESLRTTGNRARLKMEDGYLAQLDWAGIGEVVSDGKGTSLCTVFYSSEPWLFDQILAAGGACTIVEPQGVRDRFVAYARSLLIA